MYVVGETCKVRTTLNLAVGKIRGESTYPSPNIHKYSLLIKGLLLLLNKILSFVVTPTLHDVHDPTEKIDKHAMTA